MIQTAETQATTDPQQAATARQPAPDGGAQDRRAGGPAPAQSPAGDGELERNWRAKQARLARQTREARKGLVEEVARRRAFEHLHEEIGTAPDKFPELYDWIAESYENGRFFLRNLALYYEVSPDLSMLVFHLRQQWIADYGLTTTPELMVLDQAMLAYMHVLRANKQIASMFSLTENLLFYPEAPHVKIKQTNGLDRTFDGYVAEDAIKQLQDRLMPIIERFNRMFLRNLAALRELQAGPLNINIAQVGQVNVGGQQVNMAEGAGRRAADGSAGNRRVVAETAVSDPSAR